ncbi:hypothetical protein [Streptomyces sp. NPDC000880]
MTADTAIAAIVTHSAPTDPMATRHPVRTSPAANTLRIRPIRTASLWADRQPATLRARKSVITAAAPPGPRAEPAANALRPDAHRHPAG